MKSSLFPFFGFRFCAYLADQILLFVVPLIIYHYTKSVSLAGLAFFIEWLPRILSLPLAGSFSDRFGSKTIYLISDLTRALVTLIVFFIIILFYSNIFISLSIMMAINSFFYAQSFIAQETLIPKIVQNKDLPKAQSWLQSIDQSALILGPLVGALLSFYIDLYYILLFSACLYFFSFCGIIFLKFPEQHKKNKSNFSTIVKLKQDFRKSIIILLNRPILIIITVLTITINLTFGLTIATAAIMATGYFNVSKQTFGIQQSVTGIVTVLFLISLPIILKKINIFWVGIISYLILCLSSIVIFFSEYYLIYVITYICIILGDSAFNVYIRTERVLWIPKQHLGKTVGLIVFLNQLSIPFSGIIIYFIQKEEYIKYCFGTIGFLMIVIFLILFKKLKRSSKVIEI